MRHARPCTDLLWPALFVLAGFVMIINPADQFFCNTGFILVSMIDRTISIPTSISTIRGLTPLIEYKSAAFSNPSALEIQSLSLPVSPWRTYTTGNSFKPAELSQVITNALLFLSIDRLYVSTVATMAAWPACASMNNSPLKKAGFRAGVHMDSKQ